MTHMTRSKVLVMSYLGGPAVVFVLGLSAAVLREPHAATTRGAPLLNDECKAQIIELPAPPTSLEALKAGLGASGADEVWSRKSLFLASGNRLVPRWVCNHQPPLPTACADVCREAHGLGVAP